MVVLYLEQPSSCFNREKKVLSDMTDREREMEGEGLKQRAGVAAGRILVLVGCVRPLRNVSATL